MKKFGVKPEIVETPKIKVTKSELPEIA